MRQSRLAGLIGSCVACVAMTLSHHPGWSEQSLTAMSIHGLLLQPPQPGTAQQQYIWSLRPLFVGADADGDEQLTQRDVDLHGLMEEGQAKGQSLMLMRWDLDGDGFITEDEIRRGARYEFRSMLNAQPVKSAKDQELSDQNASKMIEAKVQQILALDSDKDGKISFSEATKSIDRRRLGGFSGRIRQFLETNAVSRETVSWAEFEAVGKALFRQIDVDGDGVISQQEFSDYRTR
jgi:Ca2+-binding EF-hand superfamily protein